MTATWEIETQIIPKYFNENRAEFFEGIFSQRNIFICDVFNYSFKKFFNKGILKKDISYRPGEFYCDAIKISEADRLIYIELPTPKKSDFTYNMYVKSYFIPYRLKNNNIEIFDMFGIDTVKNKDIGFIIRYEDAQHMISNLRLPISIYDRNNLIKFMSKYIFERI